MKELLLHVGMDKTGTTAVQSFLRKNRSLLKKESGLCFPQTGQWQDYSHHPFAFSVFGQHGYEAKNLKVLFKSLAKESRNAKRVLLSSECLFKAPTRAEFILFRKLCEEHFSSIKVLVYLRPQDAWVESRYKHSVLSGDEIPLDKLMGAFFCDYLPYIDRWADAFGRENVQVRPFQREQFFGKDVYSDFMHALGLELHDRYRFPESNLNVALSLDGVAFKSCCNRIGFLGEAVHQLNSFLVEHAGKSSRTKSESSLLAPAERTNLLTGCEESNRAIAIRYLNRSDGKLFTSAADAQKIEWKEYLGLEKSSINEIRDFILERSPRLVQQIEQAISEALVSENELAQQAARTLNEAFSVSGTMPR